MKTKLIMLLAICLNTLNTNAQDPSTPPAAPNVPYETVLQLKSTKEKLAAAERSLGEANTKIAALQDTNTKLDQDLERVEKSWYKAQADVEKLIAEKATAKAAASTIEQQLVDTESSLAKAKAELAETKTQLDTAETANIATEKKLSIAQADLQAALEVKTETAAKNAVDDALFSRQPKGMAGVTPVAGEAQWVTSLRARIVKAKVDQTAAVAKGASEKALKGIQVALDSYQAAIDRRMTPDQIAFILRFRDNGGLKQGDIDDLNEAIKASGGSNTTASSPKVSPKSGTWPNLRPN